jgi:predicted deacetylase
MSRTLCIAVHDVAPATWPRCEVLLELLRTLGGPRATLLVVPDYHRRGSVEENSAFVRAIDGRIARGDEIALHGYYHVDDGPAAYSALEWLQRRVLTASEGEFAALTECEAELRISAGLRMFDRLGWNVAGFVAPAWLLGAGSRAALALTQLRYTSTRTHLEMIADGRRIAAPVISASARSSWRRWTSRQFLRATRAMTRNAPLLRIALHPADVDDADLLAAWRELLAALLADRIALTKSAALTSVLTQTSPIALARA